MAKDWAAPFYNSPIWKAQRMAYAKSVHGICEICGEPGEIVHHKRHLTMRSICDPHETLAFENLQLLCRNCHAMVHGKMDTEADFAFDSQGNLCRLPPMY